VQQNPKKFMLKQRLKKKKRVRLLKVPLQSSTRRGVKMPVFLVMTPKPMREAATEGAETEAAEEDNTTERVDRTKRVSRLSERLGRLTKAISLPGDNEVHSVVLKTIVADSAAVSTEVESIEVESIEVENIEEESIEVNKEVEIVASVEAEAVVVTDPTLRIRFGNTEAVVMSEQLIPSQL
jgi:hypothetical protein